MCMRTTLSIDDDVLTAVKERAHAEGRTAGEVLSELARRALTGTPREVAGHRNGFPVLPSRGAPVSDAAVERIRAQEGV